MEPRTQFIDLPSGKRIIRIFDGKDQLLQEMHAHGKLAIGISITVDRGRKISETYFVERRPASRKAYEQGRAAYPDMPPADHRLPDTSENTLKAVHAIEGMQRLLKQHRLAEKWDRLDPRDAAANDTFCTELLANGKSMDAVAWIKNKNHAFGKRNPVKTKRLLKRLSELGCVRLLACDIEWNEDDDENEDRRETSGHLLVELPAEAEARVKIFRALRRAAFPASYHARSDHGQRFGYLRMD